MARGTFHYSSLQGTPLSGVVVKKCLLSFGLFWSMLSTSKAKHTYCLPNSSGAWAPPAKKLNIAL